MQTVCRLTKWSGTSVSLGWPLEGGLSERGVIHAAA